MVFDIRTAVTELFMIQQIKTGILWMDAIIFGFFIFTLYQGTILTNAKSAYKKIEVIKNQSIKKNWHYLTNKFKKSQSCTRDMSTVAGIERLIRTLIIRSR